jgi:hypothetical protein
VGVRDWFRRGGIVVKALVVLVAIIIFTGVAWFLIQSGLAIVFGVFAVVVAVAIAALFLWKKYRKFAYLDLLREAYLKLFRATMLASFPYEVPLIIKNNEKATIESFAGMVQGRTMLPVDESVDVIKEMGEPVKVKRETWNEDNETEVFEEDNILWVFRVRQPKLVGRKEVLCIVADSQISELSRDATGDIQVGTPILAYGHWFPVGNFFCLWNKDVELEREIKGVKTVAVSVALERYISRLGQITMMDTKTRPEILEKKEVRKHEAEAIET